EAAGAFPAFNPPFFKDLLLLHQLSFILLCQDPLSHVLDQRHCIGFFPGWSDERGYDVHPNELAIFAPIALVDAIPVDLSGNQIIETLQAAGILKMGNVLDILSDNFFGGVPQHFVEGWITTEDDSFSVGGADADTRLFKDGAQASFALDKGQ